MAILTDEYKYEKIKEYINNTEGYKLLTKEKDYKSSKTKLTIQHDCGNIFYCRGHHFLKSNSRCPKCNKDKYFPKRKTLEMFKQEVFDLVKDEYTVISKNYESTNKKIKLLHKCGYVYEVSPKHFLYSGSRCPKCRNMSKGENKIQEKLNELNIIYKKEFSFKELWNKNHTSILEFDFALFKNNKLVCLIEYDGIQHFIPTFPLNGSLIEKQEAFIKIQENDKIKNDFCKNNNILLFRISYKNDINLSLNNILERFNDYPEMEYTF